MVKRRMGSRSSSVEEPCRHSEEDGDIWMEGCREMVKKYSQNFQKAMMRGGRGLDEGSGREGEPRAGTERRQKRLWHSGYQAVSLPVVPPLLVNYPCV